MRRPNADHRKEDWMVAAIALAIAVQTGLVFFDLLT